MVDQFKICLVWIIFPSRTFLTRNTLMSDTQKLCCFKMKVTHRSCSCASLPWPLLPHCPLPSSAKTLKWPMTLPATNKSKSIKGCNPLNYVTKMILQLPVWGWSQSGRKRQTEADRCRERRNDLSRILLLHLSRRYHHLHLVGCWWERIPALWCSPARRSPDARSRGQALGRPPCCWCPVNVTSSK